MYVGKGRNNQVEKLCNVRWVGHDEAVEVIWLSQNSHDFYQTPSTVIASIFLKQVDKSLSSVNFEDGSVRLDLQTSDHKQYVDVIPTYGVIKPAESKYIVTKTKLELTLAKNDGIAWPVLRADERHKGEIIQTGRAGIA